MKHLLKRCAVVWKMCVGLFIAAAPVIGCGEQTHSVTESGAAAFHYGDINNTIALTVIQSSKDDDKFVILDVRTPEEFSDGHIEGAINIDYYADGFKKKLAALPRNKTYLIYCRSGNRSGTTMSLMKSLGFNAVFNMLGGMNEWIRQGNPVM
jgi:rhodanese-related sulfurtransferase